MAINEVQLIDHTKDPFNKERFILPATEAKQDNFIGNQINGTQKAQNVDEDGRIANLDSITNHRIAIESEHHEIHEGDHYYMQGYLELNNGDDFYVKMTTPDSDKWIHFVFDIKSTGICESTLDEDATGGMTGGEEKTPFNNNRNSPNTSELAVVSGVTACTSYGKRLEDDKWGANGWKQSEGGAGGRNNEIILKRNTIYCRSFKSYSDNNIIQFRASWYEHINK